ncbi:hypothetical protein FMEAI12_2280007 [Parafrankia sp. Ea1.12]|nr:hypothetical protein FMEAI12_2280007 [Parafrankia sp. Ea1.12]
MTAGVSPMHRYTARCPRSLWQAVSTRSERRHAGSPRTGLANPAIVDAIVSASSSHPCQIVCIEIRRACRDPHRVPPGTSLFDALQRCGQNDALRLQIISSVDIGAFVAGRERPGRSSRWSRPLRHSGGAVTGTAPPSKRARNRRPEVPTGVPGPTRHARQRAGEQTEDRFTETGRLRPRQRLTTKANLSQRPSIVKKI